MGKFALWKYSRNSIDAHGFMGLNGVLFSEPAMGKFALWKYSRYSIDELTGL